MLFNSVFTIFWDFNIQCRVCYTACSVNRRETVSLFKFPIKSLMIPFELNWPVSLITIYIYYMLSLHLHCLINSSTLIKLATAHRRIKRCTAFSSCPIYKSYIGQTNRKRNESTLLVWAILVYLLGPEPRAALDHATPLYTALGDTVKKVVEFTAESITSLSNFVRSIQILLKLQTSEQTPLMWKPGETLFNKHITTIHHGFNIVRLQEQLVVEMV